MLPAAARPLDDGLEPCRRSVRVFFFLTDNPQMMGFLHDRKKQIEI
jgi:hypothetical protein